MDAYIWGELAALGASVCFTFGPTFFTLAGRELGGITVNRMRLLLGTLYLVLFHWLYYGTPFPPGPKEALGYLLLSGAVGMGLGDAFMLSAFVCLGPRMTLLILNLSPVLATVAAWVLFQEHLSLEQLMAIGLVLGGVSWVVLERGEANEEGERPLRYPIRGIIYAVIAAVVGTIGTLLAKQGLRLGLPPISGSMVRLFGGMLVTWVWTTLSGQFWATWRAFLSRPRAFLFTALGVLIGPVLGMTLMLVAMNLVPLGIATTLASLAPVLILPIGRWIFKERISGQAIVGTLLATAGVIWLLGGR
ncbi:MAG: DMT family transporter [Chloroflexi bacterium]|nr:DMT family transporter [Chloroflexota bacterium]